MNTLKLIYKNLKGSKISTIFNFIGLITAFSAFILIMLYVWTEYNFDSYHEDAENIYRLEIKSPDKEKTSVYMVGQTKDVIAEQLPEVVATTTYMPWGKWGEILFEWEVNGTKQRSYEDYAIADKYLTERYLLISLTQMVQIHLLNRIQLWFQKHLRRSFGERIMY